MFFSFTFKQKRNEQLFTRSKVTCNF